MNKKAQKRLIISGLAIVGVIILMVAFAGARGTLPTPTIAGVLSGDFENQRIKVDGTVVTGSYHTEGTTTVFSIYDPNGDPNQTLEVHYEGSLTASLGGGTIAICTGTLNSSGILEVGPNGLLTKCPSKYESAEGAYTVGQVVRSTSTLLGAENVRLAGYIKTDTLEAADADIRFVVYSQNDELPVVYKDALPEGCEEGSAVVITGVLEADGNDGYRFVATDIALENIS
ncbi:MAG: cytochrome c maturation protein CcmE [Coriobacteriales bacterium]|jgi:cytochrome c-type biogenesis protein CcmE|nr:cytochrome c maturation protein CcmE [Coriobacteriales bacterium]